MDLSTKELEKHVGRTDFDSIMQGSFVHFAKGFKAEGEEYGGRGGKGGSYRGEEGTGLTSNQVAKMYNYVVGNEPMVAKVTKDNADKVFDRLNQALDAGIYVPAGIDLDGKDDGYGHAITVMENDGNKVTYADSLDKKIKTMPVDEFKKRLTTDGMAILPEQFAEGLKKAPISTMDNFTEAVRHPIVFFHKMFNPQEDKDDWGGRGGSGGSSR